jgi:hypothetical protein
MLTICHDALSKMRVGFRARDCDIAFIALAAVPAPAAGDY